MLGITLLYYILEVVVEGSVRGERNGLRAGCRDEDARSREHPQRARHLP